MSGMVNQTCVTGTELLSVKLTEMLIRELLEVMVACADAASGGPTRKHNKTWIVIQLIKTKPNKQQTIQ